MTHLSSIERISFDMKNSTRRKTHCLTLLSPFIRCCRRRHQKNIKLKWLTLAFEVCFRPMAGWFRLFCNWMRKKRENWINRWESRVECSTVQSIIIELKIRNARQAKRNEERMKTIKSTTVVDCLAPYHVIAVMLLHGHFFNQKLLFDHLALLLHLFGEFLMNLLWYVRADLIGYAGDVVVRCIVEALRQPLHQLIMIIVVRRRCLVSNLLLHSHAEHLFQLLRRLLNLLAIDGHGRFIVAQLLLLLRQQLRFHLLYLAVTDRHLICWCFMVVNMIVVGFVRNSRLRHVVDVAKTAGARRWAVKRLRRRREVLVDGAFVVFDFSFVAMMLETRSISILIVLLSLNALELHVVQNTAAIICAIGIVGWRWGQYEMVIDVSRWSWRWRQQRLILHALFSLPTVARLTISADDDVVGLLRNFRLCSDRRLRRWHRFVVKHACGRTSSGWLCLD